MKWQDTAELARGVLLFVGPRVVPPLLALVVAGLAGVGFLPPDSKLCGSYWSPPPSIQPPTLLLPVSPPS